MDPREQQLEALQESLRVSPQNVPLRRMVAQTLLSLGRYEDAEKEARAALQIDAGDAGCKRVLAQVYLHLGKLNLGLVLAEDVLAAMPEDGETWLLHARLLLRDGNLDDARQSYRMPAPSMKRCGTLTWMRWRKTEAVRRKQPNPTAPTTRRGHGRYRPASGGRGLG